MISFGPELEEVRYYMSAVELTESLILSRLRKKVFDSKVNYMINPC